VSTQTAKKEPTLEQREADLAKRTRRSRQDLAKAAKGRDELAEQLAEAVARGAPERTVAKLRKERDGAEAEVRAIQEDIDLLASAEEARARLVQEAEQEAKLAALKQGCFELERGQEALVSASLAVRRPVKDFAAAIAELDRHRVHVAERERKVAELAAAAGVENPAELVDEADFLADVDVQALVAFLQAGPQTPVIRHEAALMRANIERASAAKASGAKAEREREARIDYAVKQVKYHWSDQHSRRDREESLKTWLGKLAPAELAEAERRLRDLLGSEIGDDVLPGHAFPTLRA
jgi:hypothetical protein